MRLRDRSAQSARVQGPDAARRMTPDPARDTLRFRSICARTGRKRCATRVSTPASRQRGRPRGCCPTCRPTARICCSSGSTAYSAPRQPHRASSRSVPVSSTRTIWPAVGSSCAACGKRRARTTTRTFPTLQDLWFIEDRTDVAEWLTEHCWECHGRGGGTDGPLRPHAGADDDGVPRTVFVEGHLIC